MLQVLRFQQFIQDNDGKRQRAETKAQGDSSAAQKLEKEAKQLKQQLESLQHEKSEVEKRLGERTWCSGVVASLLMWWACA